jgi:uncharacterized membrane protein YqaE (UPF0057 family)
VHCPSMYCCRTILLTITCDGYKCSHEHQCPSYRRSLAALHWELNMANLMRTSALLLCMARLRFCRSMTTIPSLWRMGAGWRLWRLSWLIACVAVSLRKGNCTHDYVLLFSVLLCGYLIARWECGWEEMRRCLWFCHLPLLH